MFCPRTQLCRSFESAPVNCTLQLNYLKCCVRNILVSSLNRVSVRTIMLSQHVVFASLLLNGVFQWHIARPTVCPLLQCGSFSCTGHILPVSHGTPVLTYWSFSSGLVSGVLLGIATCIFLLGVLWYRTREIEESRLALAADISQAAALEPPALLVRLGPRTPSQRQS